MSKPRVSEERLKEIEQDVADLLRAYPAAGQVACVPREVRALISDLRSSRARVAALEGEVGRLRGALVAVKEQAERLTPGPVTSHLLAGLARVALGLCSNCGRPKGESCARGEC
jgi:hypothetical protein